MKRLFYFIFISLLSLPLFSQTIISREEYKKLKSVNEIYQIDGTDIISIPENMLNDFMKNLKPKQNQTLNKITDITLDGYITDALNTNPLEGIKITAEIYDGSTPIDTVGPAITDFTGHYQLSGITDVEDEQTPNNQAILQYKGNKIFSNNFNEKTLKIYTEIGEEVKSIKTNNPDVEINLQGMAGGRYITILEMDKKAYANMIIADAGIILSQKKLEDKITEKNINKLEKINSIGAMVDIVDPANNYHSYLGGPAGVFENNNPRRDFTLIPRMNLEFPIIDPEYTVIPTINTLRDLIWYTARCQGDWNNLMAGPPLFPIKLFIDTCNAPVGGVVEARNVIYYYQDSIGIHPDSLIKESAIDVPPAFNNGFSSAKMIWTDSIGTEGYNSIIDVIFSSSHGVFIGTRIYIDTNKVQGEDIGKYIVYQLQRYITGGVHPINNPNYLGYTTGTRIGPRKRPNNDEKKFIKIGRFTKPFYINRVYP